MEKFKLDGRVILLTGAAGYLGKSIAKHLAASGAEVILSGRSKERLDSLAADIGAGGRAHVLKMDITNEASRQDGIDFIQQKFGRLNGLINNAYSGKVGSLDAITAQDFSLACENTLIGPFSLIQKAIPLLEMSGKNNIGGVIVNIASMYGAVSPDPKIYGDSGANNPVHYGAAKAGLIQMTRYLACHLASKGIRANSISPGPFPRQEASGAPSEFIRKLRDKVPMGRIGEPDEIAGPVVFLLSDAASYITGANLPVDGGWTAW